jgi:hypothetical protein
VYLPRTEQNAYSDRKVVGRSSLLKVGRRQVHGNSAKREFTAAVPQCSPYTLSGFLNGGIGKAHNVESR